MGRYPQQVERMFCLFIHNYFVIILSEGALCPFLYKVIHKSHPYLYQFTANFGGKLCLWGFIHNLLIS